MADEGKERKVYRHDPDVTRRYRVLKKLGRGCYGIVFEAQKLNTDDDDDEPPYAMKKILNAFKNETDAQRTYREVSYMMEFGDHENIIKVRDCLVSADDRHLYIFMDMMDSDLAKALMNDCLEPPHKPLIAYQLTKALKYIHSAQVMHRDLKPSNVLVDISCNVRLADFGWARTSPVIAIARSAPPLTDYASARWYRSPEQTLSARYYTLAVDLWALGCIVAEMHIGRPLLAGTSCLTMMTAMISLLGKPLDGDIAAMDECPPGPHNDGAKLAAMWMEAVKPCLPTESLADLLKKEDEVTLDFLELLIQFNPKKRMSAADALAHPYLSGHADPDNEPVFGRAIRLALPDTEKFSPGQYRDQVYANVMGFAQAKRSVDELMIKRALDAEEVPMLP